VSHPGFPEVLNRLGDEAIGKTALQASSGDHISLRRDQIALRSQQFDANKSRENATQKE
jgi:hypothetical protein